MAQTQQDIAQRLEEHFSDFMKIIHDMKRQSELRPMEHGVVRQLYHCQLTGQGEMLPSQLSQIMGVHHPAVTPALNHLEEMGYVQRRHSSSDRRKVYVVLTQKGTDFACQQIEKRHQMFLQIVNYLGEDEALVLERSLLKLTEFYHQKL